jgi:hypothetical protein
MRIRGVYSDRDDDEGDTRDHNTAGDFHFSRLKIAGVLWDHVEQNGLLLYLLQLQGIRRGGHQIS